MTKRLTKRSGFTLIEVMVSMVMLAIILVSLARASTVIAVRGRSNDLVAKRTAILQTEANKFGAMSFAALQAFPTTTKSFTRGDFAYTRRLTITSQSAINNRYTVKIVVIPTTDPTKTDSVILDRSLPPTGSPLCVGC